MGANGSDERTLTQVVIVSGFRIFPMSTGGHLRTGSVARALARSGYEVLLYSLAGRRNDYSLRHPRCYRIDEIEPGLIEETHLGLTCGVLQMGSRMLDLPRLWQYGLLRNGLVPARLRTALAQADAVISDLAYCPPIPGPWRGKPWYLLSHQLEHRLLEQSTPRHRRFAGFMRRAESIAPHRYTDIFACATEDRDFFRARDRRGVLRVPIIPCAVDSSPYIAKPGARERVRSELGLSADDRVLVFSGSAFKPNLDALERLKEFARSESEFLRDHRLFILILGSLEPVPYREGSLIATGRVPEVISYFAAADAGLNPVTTGAGANVKLFEYLAARLPVISTEFGVRGSALRPDEDFVPYDPQNPRRALLRFVKERTAGQWRDHAEAVWQRHKRSCDIVECVRTAVAQARDFPAASASTAARATAGKRPSYIEGI